MRVTTARRGVWTGEVARIISVGFLGVRDQTMGVDGPGGDMHNMASIYMGDTNVTADYRLERIQAAYTALVCKSLARQARTLAYPSAP